MSFVIRLGDDAVADLDRLHGWIEEQAGDAIADQYDRRIRLFIRTLADFPHRGTPQGDSELRTITFERHQVIAYRVIERSVHVLRILNGRRDWRHLLPG